MNYQIAGLRVNVTGENAYVANRMQNYLVSESGADADCYMNFRKNDCIMLPLGEVYQKTNHEFWIQKPDGSIATFYAPIFTDIALRLTDYDASFRKADIQLVDTESLGGAKLDRKIFMALGEAFSYQILQHNGIVFHSSAVSVNGQAVLFSAPSGTGKSTHTSLWRRYYPDQVKMINDDTPAIRILDGKPFVYGTPWSGKTELNNPITSPLRAIVFLRQSDTNEIALMHTAESVANLLSQTRKYIFENCIQIAMDRIEELLGVCKVPIYRLSCNISKDAVDLVKKTLALS